jgi:ATP-dependent RNA helicase SUPV3L1/SUV3
LLLLFRNIKRIIFDTLYKFDGTGLVPVPAQQIRQISGRAGRFNTKHEIGLVTCSKTEEFSILENALNDTDPQPYKQAGIAPTFEQIDRIRHEFAQFDLADILDAFTAFAKLPAQYFLSDMRAVRRLLELLRGLDLSSVNLEELFLFLSAPVKVDNEECASTFLFVQPHTHMPCLL